MKEKEARGVKPKEEDDDIDEEGVTLAPLSDDVSVHLFKQSSLLYAQLWYIVYLLIRIVTLFILFLF